MGLGSLRNNCPPKKDYTKCCIKLIGWLIACTFVILWASVRAPNRFPVSVDVERAFWFGNKSRRNRSSQLTSSLHNLVQQCFVWQTPMWIFLLKGWSNQLLTAACTLSFPLAERWTHKTKPRDGLSYYGTSSSFTDNPATGASSNKGVII